MRERELGFVGCATGGVGATTIVGGGTFITIGLE
jgi:hypothetical protein